MIYEEIIDLRDRCPEGASGTQEHFQGEQRQRVRDTLVPAHTTHDTCAAELRLGGALRFHPPGVTAMSEGGP
jgi:hypothetical protein